MIENEVLRWKFTINKVRLQLNYMMLEITELEKLNWTLQCQLRRPSCLREWWHTRKGAVHGEQNRLQVKTLLDVAGANYDHCIQFGSQRPSSKGALKNNVAQPFVFLLWYHQHTQNTIKYCTIHYNENHQYCLYFLNLLVRQNAKRQSFDVDGIFVAWIFHDATLLCNISVNFVHIRGSWNNPYFN